MRFKRLMFRRNAAGSCRPHLSQSLVLLLSACLVLASSGAEAKLEAGSAVDLDEKTFDAFLSNLPADATVLMEYYAHW